MAPCSHDSFTTSDDAAPRGRAPRFHVLAFFAAALYEVSRAAVAKLDEQIGNIQVELDASVETAREIEEQLGIAIPTDAMIVDASVAEIVGEDAPDGSHG